MKKLINNPRSVVREMLEGLVAQSAELALLADENVVLRHPLPAPEKRTVAIISGGGSGHEPAHAGYVGEGMLTAAVAGDVFASPSSDAVLAGIRAAAGPSGAVLIVKNYTGDRLNFGLAAELARSEGIPIEVVVVADDVALHATVPRERRRGIAGTLFVHKIAGAAAARGDDLVTVARLAREAAQAIGSMGVALGACTLPAAGKPGFVLGDDEIELGLGIHGEAGVSRTTLQPAAELARVMIDAIIKDLGVTTSDRLALLVNGLGATPPMELAIIAREAAAELRRQGLQVERAWTGTFLTALDMPGCSLSLLTLNPERLALVDAPTQAAAWPRGGRVSVNGGIVLPGSPARAQPPVAANGGSPELRASIIAAAKVLIESERLLTDLDARAGDGDLGQSLARGAEAVMALPEAVWRSAPADVLRAVGEALRRAIGGSSGPFYATGLLRAARSLESVKGDDIAVAAEAFEHAVEGISALGGARAGDRTMVDALAPVVTALRAAATAREPARIAWAKAAAAAEAGARATATMPPRLGRASYLGARAMGVPDGGAQAVSIWLAAVAAAQN